MKRLPLLLLLLVPVLRVAAEEEADPVAALPGALRPGASIRLERAPSGDRLRGKVSYRALAGEEAGTVKLVLEFATADLGPLTFRDRLTAVLDAKTRSVRSFDYEVAGKKPGPLTLLSRLRPDEEREGRFVHERFRYPEEGDPRVIRTKPKPAAPWFPDLLEAFLLGLLELPEDGTATARLLTVERGRVLRSPVVYRLLGGGKMDAGSGPVPCRILTRRRGDDTWTVYLRSSDSMPLKFGPMRIPEPEEER